MSGDHELDANCRFRLAELAAHVSNLRLDPNALRMRLLDGLLSFVPAEGPCSVLQFNRFLTEGGNLIAAPYHKNPPADKILDAWTDHIKRSASEIERRLFACKGKLPVGYARLCDLFDSDEWHTMPLYSLAIQADVGDMAYLWIRCSKDDLWILCLRRRSFEPNFTEREFRVLEEFGLWFGANRQSWYVEDLQLLSDRELECVRLLAGGIAAKNAAIKLGIAKKTYEKHQENARKKLGVETSFELLSKLLHRVQDAERGLTADRGVM